MWPRMFDGDLDRLWLEKIRLTLTTVHPVLSKLLIRVDGGASTGLLHWDGKGLRAFLVSVTNILVSILWGWRWRTENCGEGVSLLKALFITVGSWFCVCSICCYSRDEISQHACIRIYWPHVYRHAWLVGEFRLTRGLKSSFYQQNPNQQLVCLSFNTSLLCVYELVPRPPLPVADTHLWSDQLLRLLPTVQSQVLNWSQVWTWITDFVHVSRLATKTPLHPQHGYTVK